MIFQLREALFDRPNDEAPLFRTKEQPKSLILPRRLKFKRQTIVKSSAESHKVAVRLNSQKVAERSAAKKREANLRVKYYIIKS